MYPRNLIGLSVVVCAVWATRLAAQKTRSPGEISGEPVTLMERTSYHRAAPTSKGFWRNQLTWRPHWVKTWHTKKVYVAVWKRMWGPVQVKEWVPVPKPPPGWVPPALEPVFVEPTSHHNA